MAIKKLQNNFTTPEQSKRLLELGVPANSADCIYLRTPDSDYDTYIITDELQRQRLSDGVGLPCWSVGRLIEIMSICGDDIGLRKLDITRVSKYYKDSVNVIELTVEDIEKLVDSDGIDFSKLEE